MRPELNEPQVEHWPNEDDQENKKVVIESQERVETVDNQRNVLQGRLALKDVMSKKGEGEGERERTRSSSPGQP